MFSGLYALFVTALLCGGALGLVIGFFLGFIPIVGRYKLPIQVVSMVLFSAGLWLGGRLAKDKEWKTKVAELEVKLAEAKAKSAEVNTETIVKVVTQRQIIKEKGDTIYKFIKESGELTTVSCTVPGDAVKAHNAAAASDVGLLSLPAGSTVPVDAVNAAANPPKSSVKLAPKK